jgi:MFS transporter, FSR family, fosmidomycin resistance protein
VGMIAGLFFGLAFGMGGIGAAVLGKLADRTSISYVFHLCAYLPLLGLLTGLLPALGRRSRPKGHRDPTTGRMPEGPTLKSS